jgi:multidrug efflux system membrane fusion protein
MELPFKEFDIHLNFHKPIQGSIALILTFFILAAGWGCSADSSGKTAPKKAVPVVVGSVIRKSVPVQLTAIGNVQPSATVSVRSLVGGTIVGVHFKEGQDVRKGDLLFSIDPRPFEQAVKQAEAAIAKDKAQAENGRMQAERYKSLIEKNLIAQDQYDQMRTNAESFEATLRADRAALENARIQLGHCSVRSPIDGRTGNILIHPGNIIKDGDALTLVVVNQINPLYVVFSLPEKNLLEIRKYMAKERLKVEARIPNDAKPAEEGVLSFVDNTIDNSTGTIQVKGMFLNKDQRLWPGQFVNVILTLSVQPDAIVVPSKAIQTGQQGQYVYVVKSDLTVEARAVIVDRSMNEESIISRGLSPDEAVVVDGQLQLVPGIKVEIKKSAPAGSGEKNSG